MIWIEKKKNYSNRLMKQLLYVKGPSGSTYGTFSLVTEKKA